MSTQKAKRLAPLAKVPTGHLLIHEIYRSIQGESTRAGLPCVFVRTAACHLRCRWCDTTYAFARGRVMTPAEVRVQIDCLGLPLVEFTGGEPLLQPAVLPLMTELCDAGLTVLLETSGSLDIQPVDPRVIKIVDLKTPSSGEVDSNRFDNVALLLSHDEVKLVIADRIDYEWARECMREHALAKRCTVLLGVVWGALAAADLAAWILADRLPVRLQLQMHKVLWGVKARGV
jgi:7-carboxy-7-deazaguanine synthase